jgi:hypothetical protein
MHRAAWLIALGWSLLWVGRGDAGLIHQYRLDGTLADDLGGPALVADGGTLGSTRYTFAANQGLSLSGGLSNPGLYSIEMVFQFATTSGFRKILDFKDRSSDLGLRRPDARRLDEPGHWLRQRSPAVLVHRQFQRRSLLGEQQHHPVLQG